MPAQNISIEERDGPLRQIILRGWSLPFEGIAMGTEQRVDAPFFNSNPVATSQVNGPVWKNTTMSGIFSDVKLFDDRNSPTLVNFPTLRTNELNPNIALSAGGSSGSRARTAITVVKAMETISRSGMHLRFQWGEIVRFGFMKTFTPTYIRQEDIEWEAEFQWTGDAEFQPIPAPQSKDLPGMLQRIIDFAKKVLKTLQLTIFQAEVWQRKLSGVITSISGYVVELLGALERIVQFALAPSELFGTIKASLTGIRLAAGDFLSTFSSVSAQVVASIGGPADSNYDNAVQSAVRKIVLRLAAESAQSELDIDKFNSPEIIAVDTILQGMSLRDVAIKFYGSAENWRLLQEFNGFQSSVLPNGTLVRIPKV